MTRPTPDDVRRAHELVGPYVRRTPTIALPAGTLAPDAVVLKLEQLQVTGSFKARGAFNLLLSRDVPEVGVVAASGGNYGLAIAHAAHTLGHRAAIFVPSTSPAAKVERLRGYGADVHVIAGFYPEALAAATDHRERTGAMWCHAYDLPEVVAGAGGVALELEEQAELDTVLVAVGGGGLIAGIATWLQGRVRVVAVETEGTAALYRAREAGRLVDVEPAGIAASSLGAGHVGEICWATNDLIEDALLVSDEAVVDAQRALWDHVRVVAEPGGAAALAALLTGAYDPAPDERVGVVVCGANTDRGAIA